MGHTTARGCRKVAQQHPAAPSRHTRADLINPLRAKFFRVNINMSLHFMSFLHIDMTQVPKILPQIR